MAMRECYFPTFLYNHLPDINNEIVVIDRYFTAHDCHQSESTFIHEASSRPGDLGVIFIDPRP